MNKNLSNEIVSTLRELIPNPRCELDFNNNYELIISVLLSAQTTDKRVNIVTKDLYKRYPDFKSLADANQSDVKEYIKTLGLADAKSKNVIALAKKIVNDYDSIVPNTMEELIKLDGVGRKTASVVLALGYNIPAFPVDTHVHRVAARLGYIKKDKSVLDAEKALKKYIDKTEWIDAHHLFLLFGRYTCKAINPICDNCKLKRCCKK